MRQTKSVICFIDIELMFWMRSNLKIDIYKSLNIHIQMEKEQKKVQDDQNDLNNLKIEVDKIQKLKDRYANQKKQIEDLSNLVEDLKSQNEQLKAKSNNGKTVKQVTYPSVKQDDCQSIPQDQQIDQKIFVQPQRHSSHFRNTNCHIYKKGFRMMSPQPKNIRQKQNEGQKYFKNTILNRVLKNKTLNEQNDEVSMEITHLNYLIEMEKTEHRQTKKKLERIVGKMRKMSQQQQDQAQIYHQNEQLKFELEKAIREKVILEEELANVHRLLRKRPKNNIDYQINAQFEKMNKIYNSIVIKFDI